MPVKFLDLGTLHLWVPHIRKAEDLSFLCFARQSELVVQHRSALSLPLYLLA